MNENNKPKHIGDHTHEGARHSVWEIDGRYLLRVTIDVQVPSGIAAMRVAEELLCRHPAATLEISNDEAITVAWFEDVASDHPAVVAVVKARDDQQRRVTDRFHEYARLKEEADVEHLRRIAEENPQLLMAHFSLVVSRVRAAAREGANSLGWVRLSNIEAALDREQQAGAASQLRTVRVPADRVAETVMDAMKSMVDAGKTDAAMDVLHDALEGRLRRKDTALAEALLGSERMVTLDDQLGVALLVITLPFKRELHSRANFGAALERRYMDSHSAEETAQLFGGLR